MCEERRILFRQLIQRSIIAPRYDLAKELLRMLSLNLHVGGKVKCEGRDGWCEGAHVEGMALEPG